MNKIIECVPNFSEGRRREVVEALAAVFTSVRGVAVLDTEMDADHNRCVITVAGEPEAVARGMIEATGRAAELIDLRTHRGEHPRMGATDVVPFVPVAGVTMQECIELSVRAGEEIADRFGIPVYLYEQSARVPARRDLAYVRRGEFEAIREEIRTLPERKPDFGPCEVHPSAGAVAVGARKPLIAYNIYLNTRDVRIAQAIARAVRGAGGGLRYLKALGMEIRERNQAQVSMNLTNYEATPVYRVFDLVEREARRYGVSVTSSEIIGLVPQRALDDCSHYYLRVENFSENQILENRLRVALPKEPGVEEFLAGVAAPEAVPGGGSVAALAGSLAAALGCMVAGLTAGRKKFEAVEARVVEIRERLATLGETLRQLVREDAAAYEEVMAAVKLPKGNDAERRTREEALARATRRATETPLRTARTAASALEQLGILVEIGNPNARSDAGVGAQMAFAAVKGAEYNVLINLPGLADGGFAAACRAETTELSARSRELLDRIDAKITAG